MRPSESWLLASCWQAVIVKSRPLPEASRAITAQAVTSGLNDSPANIEKPPSGRDLSRMVSTVASIILCAANGFSFQNQSVSAIYIII
jgi:hypothetical protein